jgi:hypothetical protein
VRSADRPFDGDEETLDASRPDAILRLLGNVRVCGRPCKGRQRLAGSVEVTPHCSCGLCPGLILAQPPVRDEAGTASGSGT